MNNVLEYYPNGNVTIGFWGLIILFLAACFMFVFSREIKEISKKAVPVVVILLLLFIAASMMDRCSHSEPKSSHTFGK